MDVNCKLNEFAQYCTEVSQSAKLERRDCSTSTESETISEERRSSPDIVGSESNNVEIKVIKETFIPERVIAHTNNTESVCLKIETFRHSTFSLDAMVIAYEAVKLSFQHYDREPNGSMVEFQFTRGLRSALQANKDLLVLIISHNEHDKLVKCLSEVMLKKNTFVKAHKKVEISHAFHSHSQYFNEIVSAAELKMRFPHIRENDIATSKPAPLCKSRTLNNNDSFYSILTMTTSTSANSKTNAGDASKHNAPDEGNVVVKTKDCGCVVM